MSTRRFWATTTSFGRSSFSVAAATPRVDVEKTPQAAAALVCQDEVSQVTSRCLFQQHHANDFGSWMEERKEERRHCGAPSWADGKHVGGPVRRRLDGWRLAQ